MIGVRYEELDMLLKKSEFYLSSIEESQKKLVDSISQIKSCYSGSSIDYLFKEPIKEIINIKTISPTVKNYSDILYGVKISYQKQDSKVSQQLNHIISKLQ